MSVVTAAEARNTIDYVRVTAAEGTDYPIDREALVHILESVVALEQRATAAEAKVAKLREALLSVEWASWAKNPAGAVVEACYECLCRKSKGHRDDCSIGKALDAGEVAE